MSNLLNECITPPDYSKLQSPGVFRAHQFRAFRGEPLKLVQLALMDFESRDTLKFAHCSYLMLSPEDVGYLAAPSNGTMLSGRVSRLSCGREYVLPSVENCGSGPSGLRSAIMRPL